MRPQDPLIHPIIQITPINSKYKKIHIKGDTMKTLTKEMQAAITPELALDLLKAGNERDAAERLLKEKNA